MNKASQRMRIIEYMRNHNGHITTAECCDYLRIMSATKRISELRQAGWNISAEVIRYRNADGFPIHYNLYTLEESNG